MARAALALAVLCVLWRARTALLPFLFALVLAYLLSPAVSALERRRLAPWLSVLVVYAAVALILAAVATEAVPVLVREGQHIVAGYPSYTRAARVGAGAFWRAYQRVPLPAPVRAEANRLIADVAVGIRYAARGTLRVLAAGVPVLAAMVVAPFLAYYMLRDRVRLWAGFWRLFPPRRRPRVAALLSELDLAVGGFLRGQILVALVVGALALLVAVLFRLPYPLFIALLAAVTDIIPYVGPLLGALPAVAFAVLRSPVEGLWVLLAFLAIHELEGTVVSPYLLGTQVGLHPLLVFGAILVGGDLFGLAGMLLAVPALAAAIVLVRYALEEVRAWAEGRAPEPAAPLPVRAVARSRPGAFNRRPRPVR